MELALTHERADFDAIASLVALARLRPAVVPILPVAVNQNVRHFLALYGGGLPLVARDAAPRSGVDRVWLVDTDSAAWPRGVAAEVERAIIDHHTHHLEDGSGQDPSVGANVTLIVEQLAQRGVGLDVVDATLFLLGVYEDTGSLSFPGTTARDLRAGAWLLDQGADLRVARRFLGDRLSVGAHALFTTLSQEAEMHEIAGRHIVIASAQAHGFNQELSPLATRLLDVHAADALFLIVDVGERVQLVARSRVDGIDAAEVARALGGGGHAKAAAAVVEGALLEDVVAAVLSHVRAIARPAAVVADIMSRGEIRTVQADQPVREAWELAGLHGHEGYPVVDDGVLVGMVTRLDLDRAVRHGLADAPVRQIVQMDPARTVHPDTSVEALQDVMLGEGAAQLPVVDMGRVVGIVTRTDLLKLWSKGRPRPAPTIVDMDRALSPARREAIHHVARAARERGERAFVVGGLPRDLLLGVTPGPDVDIVVEGDAVGLARLLEARHGGKVRIHERFGTAKWMLSSSDSEELDLATARTEFYESATALPGVRGSSIENDLRRRDFTVNTLAADIDEDRYGQVLDLFGGVADLRGRTIRVLHSLSFIEDPTRILRAARLCVRLGFNLEERTEAQARHAADLLGRVSGARIRAELLQTFREPRPADVLGLMDDLGALGAIAPCLSPLRSPGALGDVRLAAETFRRLRPELTDHFPDPSERELLATWLTVQHADQDTHTRLALPRDIRETAAAASRLRRDPVLMNRDSAPVALHGVLGRTLPDHLAPAWAAGDGTVRANIERYVRDVLGARPVITGDDLLAFGAAPGPAYARALEAVLEAMLNGTAPDRESQLAVARAALDHALEGE